MQTDCAGAQSELLTRAFQDFDQAATVLQQSYAALTARLQQMDVELAETNASLRLHLRETEQMRAHVTAVLESLETGVIVADAEGLVVRCNRSTEHLLGCTQGDLAGRSAAAVVEDLRGAQDEYPVILPNGTAIVLSQSDVHDPAGALIGKLVLIHDVTHVRRLEARLQRRNRLEAMGRMVGSIAHEIRNPLGSVELFASMLRKDLADRPQAQAYAEHISLAVRSMDRLLSNLLVYTKPDCSNVRRHATETILRDVLTLAAHATASASIEVRRQVEEGASWIWCDAAKMQQVLLNLVLNAVQAMPSGGRLTITAAQVSVPTSDRPVLQLTISDTGVGIPAEMQSRVFDPFFTTKDHGTGLGLAIVHALVEAHQGRIDLESRPGHGTSFVITLPIGPSAATDRPESDGKACAAIDRSRHVEETVKGKDA